jgi:hypothetical protein
MIHILSSLTSDYELQLAMMERTVGDTDRPLTVEEIRGDLSLCFERLNSNSTNNREGEILEEQALFSEQFKGKCHNCGLLDTSHFSARIVQLTMVEITVTQVAAFFVCIVASLAMTSKIVSN